MAQTGSFISIQGNLKFREQWGTWNVDEQGNTLAASRTC